CSRIIVVPPFCNCSHFSYISRAKKTASSFARGGEEPRPDLLRHVLDRYAGEAVFEGLLRVGQKRGERIGDAATDRAGAIGVVHAKELNLADRAIDVEQRDLARLLGQAN